MRVIACILYGVLICQLAACGSKKKEAPKGRPPAPVLIATASTRTIPVVLEAVGNVEAYNSVVVRSQVNGEITAVNFREGQDVAAGQTLFTLDRRATDAAIRKAEANLTRLAAIQKNARTNAERYEKLVGDGIVTREQYEAYRTQAESADADLAADRAELENLRVQLSYLTIKAPMAGRTGNLAVNRGNVVKANDTAMVILNQIRPIYVTFAIPERELPRIRQYLGKGRLKVEVRLSGDSGPPEIGEVTFLDNAVDMTTATIKLKGTFANLKTRLWPGQFASVRLTLSAISDAVVVPTQAVQTGQKGQYLFVVSGDTAELRPVKVGVAYEGVTVIEQGLKPGETVVIDGQMRVVPGGKIQVKTADTKQGSGKEPGQGAGGKGQGGVEKSLVPAVQTGSTKP
jgi:multidrug efflux system membrane fusion protein